jgi:hypothetical protein
LTDVSEVLKGIIALMMEAVSASETLAQHPRRLLQKQKFDDFVKFSETRSMEW